MHNEFRPLFMTRCRFAWHWRLGRATKVQGEFSMAGWQLVISHGWLRVNENQLPFDTLRIRT